LEGRPTTGTYRTETGGLRRRERKLEKGPLPGRGLGEILWGRG